MMRRLRLGDVVESERRLGSPTRAMAAGTSRRATTEGVADAPVPAAQTAELTVHGTPDGTSSVPRRSMLRQEAGGDRPGRADGHGAGRPRDRIAAAPAIE